eukprot:COSAG06_NODE_2502_length_6752_cov_242.261386_7_plen_51_part_00
MIKSWKTIAEMDNWHQAKDAEGRFVIRGAWQRVFCPATALHAPAMSTVHK